MSGNLVVQVAVVAQERLVKEVTEQAVVAVVLAAQVDQVWELKVLGVE
jgi:hypothetical protein